jgi:hypothetical protein
MSHDPTQTPTPAFPRLTPTNHRVTSPTDPNYNCAAWAAGDATHWWEPMAYWPDPTGQRGYTPADLIRVFESVGYTHCPTPDPEPGFEKVAVYARGGVMSHAARQLPSGAWTSKLGDAEDIEHDSPEDVAGGAYGSVHVYLRRPLPPVS